MPQTTRPTHGALKFWQAYVIFCVVYAVFSGSTHNRCGDQSMLRSQIFGFCSATSQNNVLQRITIYICWVLCGVCRSGKTSLGIATVWSYQTLHFKLKIWPIWWLAGQSWQTLRCCYPRANPTLRVASFVPALVRDIMGIVHCYYYHAQSSVWKGEEKCRSSTHATSLSFSSYQVMEERLRYAIRHCRTIDMDNYMLQRGSAGVGAAVVGAVANDA